MLLGIFFVKPALPPAALAETSSTSTENDEATEQTPLVNPDVVVSQQEDVNVSGWALFKEVDFYLIFLYNGLCSGVGLCCERSTYHRTALISR